GFWTAPLLVHLADTRAIAWGALTPALLGEILHEHPVVVALAALAVVAIVRARDGADRALAWWPWAIAVVVALDALVLEPLGARWLPADRVMDSFWLALVLAACLGSERSLRRRWPPAPCWRWSGSRWPGTTRWRSGRTPARGHRIPRPSAG